MNGALEDRVRSRAYEIWESEGRPNGRSLTHWDQAMREFAPVGARAKTRAKKAAANGIAPVGAAERAKSAKSRPAARSTLN